MAEEKKDVPIKEQEDGTVVAYGKATDDTLDSDSQVCDPAWLSKAMPEWFKYGNIREQHSNIAAGVATEYEAKGKRFCTQCSCYSFDYNVYIWEHNSSCQCANRYTTTK